MSIRPAGLARMGYPNRAQEIIINAAEKLMEATMAGYDPSHDVYHVQRVRKTALALAISPEHSNNPPDLFVVELAALLHDILDKKYVSPSDANKDTYTYFLPYFREWSAATIEGTYGQEVIDLEANGQGRLIARVVENVSWSTEKKLREQGKLEEWHSTCIELHCVQDADRLDAIGAFGIMRCAAFSSATSRPLHVPSADPNYAGSAIAHFHDKLFHIKDRLKTESGRSMGAKRHQLMLDFVAAVEEEYEPLPSFDMIFEEGINRRSVVQFGNKALH